MKIVKVYFLREMTPELQDYMHSGLADLPVEVKFKNQVKEADLEEYLAEVDIIVGWQPTQELLDSASKLSLLINPGAGVQHLKQFYSYFNEREIVLINGHGNSYFTAQHTVALLLSLTNRVVFHHNAMVEGNWRLGDKDAASIPLRDRKIGLLGYGEVNRKVHRFLSGFQLDFSILKRDWSKPASAPTAYRKYEFSQLHEFLTEIDTLILAVPLTDKTKNLIGTKELKLLGKDGIIINMARGKVVNEEALFNALKHNTINTAAVDVWYDYQPEADEQGRKFPSHFPFHELDNILLSPHRAASPFSDLQRWNEVIENISRFSRDEKEFLYMVDMEEGY